MSQGHRNGWAHGDPVWAADPNGQRYSLDRAASPPRTHVNQFGDSRPPHTAPMPPHVVWQESSPASEFQNNQGGHSVVYAPPATHHQHYSPARAAFPPTDRSSSSAPMPPQVVWHESAPEPEFHAIRPDSKSSLRLQEREQLLASQQNYVFDIAQLRKALRYGHVEHVDRIEEVIQVQRATIKQLEDRLSREGRLAEEQRYASYIAQLEQSGAYYAQRCTTLEETLQDRENQINVQIDGMQASAQQRDITISNLEATEEMWKEQVARVEQLQEAVQSLTAQLQHQEAQLQAQHAQAAAQLQAQQGQATAQLQAQQAQFQAQQTQMDHLKSQLSAAKAENIALESGKVELLRSLELHIHEHSARFEHYAHQTANLSAESARAQQEAKDKGTMISRMENEIVARENDIIARENEIQARENEIEFQENEIKTLHDKNAALARETSQIRQQANGQAGVISRMESEIQAREIEIQAREQEVHALRVIQSKQAAYYTRAVSPVRSVSPVRQGICPGSQFSTSPQRQLVSCGSFGETEPTVKAIPPPATIYPKGMDVPVEFRVRNTFPRGGSLRIPVRNKEVGSPQRQRPYENAMGSPDRIIGNPWNFS